MPSQAGTYDNSDLYNLTAVARRRVTAAKEQGDLVQEESGQHYAFAQPTGRTVSLEVVQGLLRLADMVTLTGSAVLVIGLAATSGTWPPLWWAIVMTAVVLFFVQMGLQRSYAPSALRDDRHGHWARRVAIAWMASATLSGLVFMAADVMKPGRCGWFLIWTVLGLMALLALRRWTASRVAAWRGQGRLAQNIAVIGLNGAARHLLARLDRCNAQDVRIAGVYADGARQRTQFLLGHRLCGSLEDLIAEARRRRIDAVVLCVEGEPSRRDAVILDRLRRIAVDIHVYDEACIGAAGQRDEHRATPSAAALAGIPLITIARLPLRGWAALAKSIEDRVIAAIILTMISPLLAVIAVLIKFDSPGPVFFSQNRYGWNNEPIRILKFRTLHHHAVDKSAGTLVSRNDSRVTRLGAFLRRTSLDELPQFINVLRGEMSIVGPRPHAAAAKAGGLLYDEAVEYYHARHRVKPGITGWAQVNGWRGETRTVDQIKARVDHDLYYIEHWSVAFDLRIIVQTVLRGFTGHQAY